MNVEKELNKTMFDPLYSTALDVDCATRIASNTLECWVEGRKPCPKCGSLHTQKNVAVCLTTYPCQFQFKCKHCFHEWTDHEYFDGSLSYQPQSEDPNPLREYGWICPKCGRVYAPHMDWCTNCNGTYSPNLVYCGTDTAYLTRDVMDTISISSNPTVSISANEIVNTMTKNAIHEELKDSIQKSNK